MLERDDSYPLYVRWLKIGKVYLVVYHNRVGIASKRKCYAGTYWIVISDIGEVKSYAYDLNKERGIVSSRVALLLRSAEIKPLFYRFVLLKNFLSLQFQLDLA